MKIRAETNVSTKFLAFLIGASLHLELFTGEKRGGNNVHIEEFLIYLI